MKGQGVCEEGVDVANRLGSYRWGAWGRLVVCGPIVAWIAENVEVNIIQTDVHLPGLTWNMFMEWILDRAEEWWANSTLKRT